MKSQTNQAPLAAKVASLAETVEEMQHGPRVTVGRMVHYVLSDGQVRPLTVTKVRRDPLGHVSGVLFFDGSNDADLLPRPAENPAANPIMSLAAVRYDPSKSPNTWHWPEKV